MAVSPEELAEIESALSASPADARLVAALRSRFPHLSWTRCEASDVTETPFRTYAHIELHLLDSADHCARITSDPACATGIVLAKRSTAS